MTDPTVHGEDCDAGNEDDNVYQVHEATCAVSPGARIDLATPPGGKWPEWPKVECCDPEEERDEAAMIAACDCSLAGWDEVLKLALGAEPTR